METAGIMLLILILCLILSIPIAFAVGIATLVGALLSNTSLFVIGQEAFTSLDKFAIMAVPFFILTGFLMETGGLSKRLIGFARSIVGNVTGGLGMVAIIACAFFAAISGSSPATVAAIGTIMIPTMVQRGYPVGFAASTSATAGGLGIVIPPSISLIMFAVLANVSVADMFLAGVFPGIFIAIILILTVYILAKRKKIPKDDTPFSWKNVWVSFLNAKWALLAPVIILGGIYSGIFTPTEAAMIAVVYGLIIGLFVHKELKVKDLPKIFIDSAVTTGAVLIILSTASAFGRVLTLQRVPHSLTEWLLSISESPIIILLLISLLLLILGMFMESLSIVIILTPILMPVVNAVGINPVHFGMIMVIGVEIAMMTPPVGVNLFVASGISRLSIERLSMAMIPFLFAMVIAYLGIIFMPQLSTFLVELFS